jgi:hypothetical protein
MTRNEFFQAAGVPYRSEPATFVTSRAGIRPIDLLPGDNYICQKPGTAIFVPMDAVIFFPSKKRGRAKPKQ